MSNLNKTIDEEIEFQNKAAEEGRLFQDKIKGIFDKYYSLGIEILDKDKSGRRPDFFVFLKDDREKKFIRGFICECKFIASAGVINNSKAHASTLDKKLEKEAEAKRSISFPLNPIKKIKEVFEKALLQYQTLVKDKPFYQQFPFVVALKLDQWADVPFEHIFDFIVEDIPQEEQKEMEKISAVMKIERDIERREKIEELPTEVLEEEIKKIFGEESNRSGVKFPPPSKRFKVLLNSEAKIKFKPKDFLKNPIVLHSKEENL